jgi:hypothetical protein
MMELRHRCVAGPHRDGAFTSCPIVETAQARLRDPAGRLERLAGPNSPGVTP